MKYAVMACEDFYLASPYLPSETILGQPLILVDGTVACCHPFTQDDLQYLVYMGATIVDVLTVGVRDDGIR